MSVRRTKRRRTGPADLVEDEEMAAVHAQANAPAFSAWSIRQPSSTAVLPLTTACLRVFAANFKAYSVDLSRWDSVKQWLTNVPDSLIPRLLGALREVCPTFLRSELISAVSSLKRFTSTGESLSPAVFPTREHLGPGR